MLTNGSQPAFLESERFIFIVPYSLPLTESTNTWHNLKVLLFGKKNSRNHKRSDVDQLAVNLRKNGIFSAGSLIAPHNEKEKGFFLI